VILVDFRALDTMGEITVLAISALGVITLLKLRVGKEKKDLANLKRYQKSK
jgi:multicomponent Na+:H+ antiporter subunit A